MQAPRIKGLKISPRLLVQGLYTHQRHLFMLDPSSSRSSLESGNWKGGDNSSEDIVNVTFTFDLMIQNQLGSFIGHRQCPYQIT
jgi:hypothetical protein